MSAPDETTGAAELIERLLVDPGLREAFRRDKAGTCRTLGLDSLAREFEVAPERAMYTQEVRESRSSLAGVVLAAAAEGIGVAHFFEHELARWHGEAAQAVHLAHTHLGMPAVPAPHPAAAPVVEPPAQPAQALAGVPATMGSTADPAHAAASLSALDDPRFSFSPDARAGLADPGMGDRVAALLTHVGGHRVTIGRVDPTGIEITQVDGRPVGPDNIAARDLVQTLSELPPGQRPIAVGTPWHIGSPGFMSEAAHRHRITVDPAFVDSTTGGAMANPKALAAIAAAKRMLGTEYVWGGDTPAQGFDCSGLVEWAYGQAGVHLGRVTYDQVTEGTPVQWGHFQPGDLIFSNWVGGTSAEHVVMYIGHGKVIEAPHTGASVHITDVDVFKGHFVAARRVVPLEQGSAPATPASPGMPAAAGGPQTLSGTPAVQAVQAAPPAGGAMTQPVPSVGGGQFVDQVSAMGHMAYPGDGASKHQIAEWMAQAARRHGLPPELPVMAALVESGLHNDQYGDADSLGYFQMRASVWGAQYPGFAHRPDLQLRWFIDQAVAVRQQRIAAGDAEFGRDPSSWGEWVADIERPAAMYRGRYALQLGAARQLLA
ncbi:MAG: NlpC/P60 family protein [Gaiellales bacterium]